MQVIFTNEQNFVEINEQQIRHALYLLKRLNKKFKLSLVYLDDAEMSKLNERYLKHQGPTDVLAFPISPKQGEVIASGETALREATARNIDPQGEIILYTIHGVLHLLGYDDKTEQEATEMHALEKDILLQLGYTWSWDDE